MDRQAPKISNSAENVGQVGAGGVCMGSTLEEEVGGNGVHGPNEFWSGPIGTADRHPISSIIILVMLVAI